MTVTTIRDDSGDNALPDIPWKANWAESRGRYIDWWARRGLVVSMWEHLPTADRPHADVPEPPAARDLAQRRVDPAWRAMQLHHELAGSSLLGDILAVAKGFSGGYLPLAATIARPEIAETIRAGGGFRHVHTYSGHATACAAALANIEIIQREGLVQRSAELGEILRPRLEELYRYPIVGDVRGIGTLWAVELVANRETREPLAPAGQAGARISAWCRERGMILRNNGDILVMAPALVMTRDQAEEMVALVDQAIAAECAHWT